MLDMGSTPIWKCTVKEWINMQSKGEEGFTAMHFACFHGNLNMLRILISFGGDYTMTNKTKISLMHVSCQGDQPAAMVYLKELGLDIN